jgi:CHAT domain-containing protein
MKFNATAFLFFLILAFKIDFAKAQNNNKIDSLLQTCESFFAKKEFLKALEVSNEMEVLIKNNPKTDSAYFGKVYAQKGKIFFTKNENIEAEKFFLKALPYLEIGLSSQNLAYILCSKSLATTYMRLGMYEKAQPIFEKIILLREKYQGKNHPDYANGLMNLGLLFNKMGKFEISEANYLAAKQVFDRNPNKTNPIYQALLLNFANLYDELALYQKAEALYLESIASSEKINGKESLIYSNNLLDIGILYQHLGNYEKAENYFLESIAISEKLQDINDPEFANKLMNYANLCADLGLYEKAEELQLKAKGIIEKVLGNEHPWYSFILNNIAGINTLMGQFENAEKLYIEASKIKEKVFGNMHPSYANSLLSLAELYLKINQNTKAEALLFESKDIFEKKIGKETAESAKCLATLGNLYLQTNQLDKAENNYLASLNIQKRLFGANHPAFSDIKSKLGTLFFKQKKYNLAETNFTESSLLLQNEIILALNHLSEKEMNQYLLLFSEKEAKVFSFNQNTGNQTNISEISYNNALFRKGFLLNAYNQIKNIVKNNESAKEKYQLLQAYSSQMAKEYTKPLAERKVLKDLEIKSNDLEKELTKTINGYGNAVKHVTWQQVQKKLAKNEAAIEFIHYKYYSLGATDSVFYAALIVLPNESKPIFVTLFNEKEIEKLTNSTNIRKADYVNNLYSLADRGVGIQKEQKSNLYDLVWKPLRKYLINVKKVFFSPSGLLHRINLDAIHMSELETMADKYQLIQLNSTRQLVLKNEMKNNKLKASIFGGIKFNKDSLDEKTENRTLKKGLWTYLPGTTNEVKSLNEILKKVGYESDLKIGFEASEEAFKTITNNKINSPKLLHIATHGYFFADPNQSVPETGNQESIFKISDNPMLRSGLILANGNEGWSGVPTLEDKEDGILTALEISQMDFKNTELAVLSACETGLGEINSNEGVYGLQRAFKIAGVKYIIMSLWQVPDKQTSILMNAFYNKLLVEKLEIPQAFHEAQKKLRESGLDPYYWAGFVLVE